MVRCKRRPKSIGRFSRNRAPNGVTSTSRDISVHSQVVVSRTCTRTGKARPMRSRRRRDGRAGLFCFSGTATICLRAGASPDFDQKLFLKGPKLLAFVAIIALAQQRFAVE